MSSFVNLAHRETRLVVDKHLPDSVGSMDVKQRVACEAKRRGKKMQVHGDSSSKPLH